MQLSIPQKHLGPKAFLTCVLLINILMIVSIDMYAPALPSMQRNFGVSVSFLNLTMLMFFAVSAIGVVLAGPLSDRHGRKPLLLTATIIFTISSVGCMLSPGVWVLTLFRAGQALGYGIMTTVETAIIKDAYEGDDMQLAMTILQSLIIVGPVAAPFLGTGMLMLSDWRGIFAFLAVCGAISIVLTLLMGETHRGKVLGTTEESDSLSDIVRKGGQLIRQRTFTSMALLMGVAGLPWFAFIAVVSYILLNQFALSYMGYNVIYAACCTITVIAPFLYRALSKHWNPRRILVLCLLLFLVSTIAMATVASLSPWLFLLAFAPFAIAEGMIRPMAFVLLLDQPDDRVGAASSVVNFSYGMLMAVGTGLATMSCWPNFIVALAAIFGGSLAIVFVLFLAWNKKAAA